jgi:large subunit ribosomal protein L17
MVSLVTNLILQGSIKTTVQKAKEARKDAEKMVTLARKGTLAARRVAAARLQQPLAVKKLFDDVVPAMEGRNGGYTRIIKTGTRRGDNAEMCVFQWVAGIEPAPMAEKVTAPAAAQSVRA